jgi:cell division protein FtsW
MADGTFVNDSKPLGAAGFQRPLRLRIDVPLLLIISTLVVFGLLMVYSASWDFSLAIGRSPSYIFTRQVMWLGVGLGVAVFLSFFNYHRYQRLAIPIMGSVLIALLVVLWINDIRLGAVRSIFQGSVQPSELAKLATIIYLSVWLYSKRERLNDVSFGLIPMAAILGITGGMILLQPDLSAALTVVILGGLLFFMAGGQWRQIILVCVIAIFLGWVVVKVNATGNARLTSYLEGLRDPIQASYHVRRSLEAVVKGGLFGVGIGRADTKFTGLPVPPTDSIFAVIAEETGLVGAAFLVGLYILLLWRGLSIARRAPDQLGSLLASGVTLWITLEALINMAVIVGLAPFAGNALPFISAGGSNLVASLAGIGILMNVARSSVEREAEEGRIFSAVVDLRRRDRRRRVSRPRRPARPAE